MKTKPNFWYQVINDFYTRQGLTRAASLAYTTLLAFVPLVVVVVKILSFFAIFDTLIKQIENFVFRNFVPHTGTIVLQYLNNFVLHAHHLPFYGFLFLFVTAMMMLFTMEAHLNELWQIKKPRPIGWSFLIHWISLTIAPALFCSGIAISSYLMTHQTLRLSDDEMQTMLHFLPFLSSLLAYLFLYLTMPRCPVKFYQAFAGALLSAALFELAKHGFILYANYFATYELLYGVLATIPLFLIWLYCAALIFLFGAQVINTLRVR